jgi:hypothetical protein
VYPADVVYIDPALSFLGGDNNAQKDVSHWLRNKILPVLIKHKCAGILIHHHNKPKEDRPEMNAYSMSGSAEWANAARACIAIEKKGSIFRMVVTKRGQRLNWKDQSGFRTTERFIAHHDGEDENGNPIIAWREATEEEVAQVNSGGRPAKVSASHVVRLLRSKSPKAMNQSEIIAALKDELGACDKTIRQVIKDALEDANPQISMTKIGKYNAYHYIGDAND